MSIDTAKSPVKIVLDTNIIISGIGFGGKPREILLLTIDKKFFGHTSTILLAELEDVINKKFPDLRDNFERTTRLIKKQFKIVRPTKTIKILEDDDDNRVLETALEGDVSYIITGDKQLLHLKKYKHIQIVTAEEFLNLHKIS